MTVGFLKIALVIFRFFKIIFKINVNLTKLEVNELFKNQS